MLFNLKGDFIMVVHSEEDIIELVKFFKKDYNTMDLTNQVRNVVDFVKGTKLSRPISCTEVDVSVHEDSTITIEYTVNEWAIRFIFFSDNQVHVQECINHITKFENVKRAIMYANRFLCI